jgi:hypothetical protein
MGVNRCRNGAFPVAAQIKSPCRSALAPPDHFYGGPSQPGAIHLMQIKILGTTPPPLGTMRAALTSSHILLWRLGIRKVGPASPP